MNKWKVFSIVVVLIIAFFLIFSTYKSDNSVKLPSGEKIGTITNIQYKYYAKALWGDDIDEGFVQQNDPNADYTIVTVNKNIKLNFNTKLTEYKFLFILLVSKIQFVPPFVVLIILPLSPTAKPVSEFKKQTEFSVFVVPEFCTDQFAPPFVDFIIVPKKPTE